MKNSGSLHRLGVICGLAAGAWLGAAEAPTKLVTVGFSPYLISLGMVAGVFVARWTLPMVLKGTGYILWDIREKPHLVVWALLAGILWAVANTLTVFAVKDVGISIAFPIWNTNSLVGLFWGWLLFGELRGAGLRQAGKVMGGALVIVAGTCLLAYATTAHGGAGAGAGTAGIAAALGAGLLWGTMYIPYRKAYLSGMNPLSFVTIFTVGELAAVLLLAFSFDSGPRHVAEELVKAEPVLFWLFLGGFCWVIGDVFQQYAAKYIGIGRGIPLSNTDQIWGLAWGVFAFGEGAGRSAGMQWMIAGGSLLMIAGAVAIGFAEAPEGEQRARSRAIERECARYGLNPERLAASAAGKDPLADERPHRSRWELLIAVGAAAVFVWLAALARPQPLAVNVPWIAALSAVSTAILFAAGRALWRRTRFS